MINDRSVIAIIQARMGSTRLPGKVLMHIEGIPILTHIINRLKQIEEIDNIIVATSLKEDDDKIEMFCISNNYICVRGSEDNVLDRFGNVSAQYPADIYIRATGDNPMIDIDLIQNMIIFFDNKELTYTCYKDYPIGSGVEIFTQAALSEALNKADKPYELEHVTPYMYQRMENRKVEYYVSTEDFNGLRMTVDTEADFEFAKRVFSRLYNRNPFFCIDDITKLLLLEPELQKINANVHQKRLEE